jgi:hypothetical protein
MRTAGDTGGLLGRSMPSSLPHSGHREPLVAFGAGVVAREGSARAPGPARGSAPRRRSGRSDPRTPPGPAPAGAHGRDHLVHAGPDPGHRHVDRPRLRLPCPHSVGPHPIERAGPTGHEELLLMPRMTLPSPACAAGRCHPGGQGSQPPGSMKPAISTCRSSPASARAATPWSAGPCCWRNGCPDRRAVAGFASGPRRGVFRGRRRAKSLQECL